MAAVLDLVGLVVKDMKASLDFYRALGMPIADGAEKDDHVECKVGSLRVAWDTASLIQSFDPTWTPPAGGHGIGLAFLCATAGEVDAIYERLIQAGYESHKAPWDAFWGQRYAVILDPDGNHVDLFAPLAVT